MALWGLLYAGNPSTTNCIWMRIHTSTRRISTPRSRTYYKEAEPSATRKVSYGTWNSLVACSNRTATVICRLIVLPIHFAGGHTGGESTSVVFLHFVGPIFNCISWVITWFDIKTRLPPRKVTGSLQSSRMKTLARKNLVSTASPANVVTSILHK
jgi:hypothetical protein